MKFHRKLIDKYLALGKKPILTHLSPDCKVLVNNAHPGFDKYIEEKIDDPRYFVVTDKDDLEL